MGYAIVAYINYTHKASGIESCCGLDFFVKDKIVRLILSGESFFAKDKIVRLILSGESFFAKDKIV